MNKFDEMREAVAEARHQLDAADSQVGTMAGMIEGRLRKGKVNTSILKALKKELRDFNIHTGYWMTR